MKVYATYVQNDEGTTPLNVFSNEGAARAQILWLCTNDQLRVRVDYGDAISAVDAHGFDVYLWYDEMNVLDSFDPHKSNR